MILGRVLLLGYRFSGGVPEILAGARLHIGTDIVRLEVGAAGRVPDSEVVGDRLRLVAAAIGVRRTEWSSAPDRDGSRPIATTMTWQGLLLRCSHGWRSHLCGRTGSRRRQ